jgi:hypothetical protein
MSGDTLPKGILDAMATLVWRAHDDELAAYAQAVEAAKRLPPSMITADLVLAALARREQQPRTPADADSVICENPFDDLFKRAARNGGDISAEIEARMRADRLRAQREKDQQT